MKDDYTVGLRSICAVLEQLLPCMDVEKTLALIGSQESVVLYSDQSEQCEFSIELVLFENTPKYIHFGVMLQKEGTSSVVHPVQCSIVIQR
jgi:hypothetical protein